MGKKYTIRHQFPLTFILAFLPACLMTVPLSASGGVDSLATKANAGNPDVCPISVNIGADFTVCAGSTIQLNGIISGTCDIEDIEWSVSSPGNGSSWVSNTGILNPLFSIPSNFTGDVEVELEIECDGCEDEDELEITVVPGISLPNSIVTNATCGQNNGAINITPTGPSTFTYNWSNGATSQDIGNLAPGTYSVTVSSGSFCSTTASFTVTNANTTLSVTGATTSPTSGQSNGAINITTSPPGTYAYLWSNGATTEDLTGLGTGTYTVTVSAGGACTATATFTLAAPPCAMSVAVVSSLTSSLPLCPGATFGLTANASGGAAPLSYQWSSGQNTQSIELTIPPWGSNYFVTVTDAAGCTATGFIHLKLTEWEAHVHGYRHCGWRMHFNWQHHGVR